MKAKAFLSCVLFFAIFSTAVLGANLGPIVFGGAYDELLPEIVRGRPLLFSGKTRVEYDDNIYLEEEDPAASWKIAVEPKVDYHNLSEDSYLGAFYQFSYRWYENRPEDDEDLSHDVGITLNHMFSNRLEIRLRDVYRDREDQVNIAEQIEVLEEGAEPEISRRRRRDLNDESYQRNDFRGSVIAKASERTSLIGTFTHLWVDYEEELRSVSNDRTEYSAGGRAEYIWKPETSISAGYIYQRVDYDQQITRVDSTTNQYYMGVNHRFSQLLVASANVGWQDRTFDSYTIEVADDEDIFVEERDQTSPYVDLKLSAPLSETLVTSMGYRYSIAETDQSTFLSEERQTLFLSVTNKFSQQLSVRFNGILQFGDFDVDQARLPGAPESFTEDTVQFALVFRYKMKQFLGRSLENWFAEAGWRYTDVDSDFPFNSYERNRTFIGINGLF